MQLGGSSQWLTTMVSCCPLRFEVGCSPSKYAKWFINGGDPNHLLTGMILQEPLGCLPLQIKNMESGYPLKKHHVFFKILIDLRV